MESSSSSSSSFSFGSLWGGFKNFTDATADLLTHHLISSSSSSDEGCPLPARNIKKGVAGVITLGIKSLANNVLNGRHLLDTKELIDAILIPHKQELAKNKFSILNEAKSKMDAALHDPDFIQLYELITGILRAQLETVDPVLTEYSKELPDYLNDLIEIQLAKGFANLAEKIKDNPNLHKFGKQPALFSLVFHLYDRGADSLELDRLLSVNFSEEKKKELEEKSDALAQSLFGDDLKTENVMSMIDYLSGQNPDCSADLARLSLLNYIGEESAQQIKQLDELASIRRGLGIADERPEKIFNKKMFDKISDLLMSEIFPNLLEDDLLPLDLKSFTLFGYLSIPESVQNWLKGQISNYLCELYLDSSKQFVDLISLVVKGKNYIDSLMDVDAKKKVLNQISGNQPFLVDLSESLSYDIIQKLPIFFGSVEEIAQEILTTFDLVDVADKEVDAFVEFVRSTQLNLQNVHVWLLQHLAPKLVIPLQNLSEEKKARLLTLIQNKNSIILSQEDLSHAVASSIPQSHRFIASFSKMKQDFLKSLNLSEIPENLEDSFLDLLQTEDLSVKHMIKWIDLNRAELQVPLLTRQQKKTLDAVVKGRVALFLQERNKEEIVESFKNNDQVKYVLKILENPMMDMDKLMTHLTEHESIDLTESILIDLMRDYFDSLTLQERYLSSLERVLKSLDVTDCPANIRGELLSHLINENFSLDDAVDHLKLKGFNINPEKVDQTLSLFKKVREEVRRDLEDLDQLQKILHCLGLTGMSIAHRRSLLKVLNNPSLSLEEIEHWVVETLFKIPPHDPEELKRFQNQKLYFSYSLEDSRETLNPLVQGIAENLKIVGPKTEIETPPPFSILKLVNSILGGLLSGETASNLQDREYLKRLIEGVLLEILTIIAKKNPPQMESDEVTKDTVVVLIDKIVNLMNASYKDLKDLSKKKTSEEALKEVSEKVALQVFTQVLGIGYMDTKKIMNEKGEATETSRLEFIPELVWLPEFAKTALFELLRDFVVEASQKYFAPLLEIKENKVALEALKAYGVNDKNEAILSSILDGAIDFGIQTALTMIDESETVVKLVRPFAEPLVENFLRKDFKAAEVIRNYPWEQRFKSLTTDILNSLKMDEAAPDLQLIKSGVKNIAIEPVHDILSALVNFDKKHEGFHVKWMMNLTEVLRDHLILKNEAKKLAVSRGVTHEVLDQYFIEAAKDKLNPAVYTTKTSFEGSLSLIEEAIGLKLTDDQKLQMRLLFRQALKNSLIGQLMNKNNPNSEFFSTKKLIQLVQKVIGAVNLTDEQKKAIFIKVNDENVSILELINLEAEAIINYRDKNGFGRAGRDLLKLAFPKGYQSLTFLDEGLRETFWNLFESKSGIILSLVADSLMSSTFIKTTLVNELKKLLKSLNEGNGPSNKVKNQENVLSEDDKPPSIKPDAKFVDVIKRLLPVLLDSLVLPNGLKQKVLSYLDLISQSLAEKLVNSVQKDFLETNLKNILSGIKDPATLFEQDDLVVLEKTLDDQLKSLVRELIPSFVLLQLRTAWADFHASLDKSIDKYFGNLGLSFKENIGMICHFIFFQIIGSLLALIVQPFVKPVQNMLFDWINLDKNVDVALGLIGDLPSDQEDRDYSIAFENLIFNLVAKTNLTVMEEYKKRQLEMRHELINALKTHRWEDAENFCKELKTLDSKPSLYLSACTIKPSEGSFEIEKIDDEVMKFLANKKVSFGVPTDKAFKKAPFSEVLRAYHQAKQIRAKHAMET